MVRSLVGSVVVRVIVREIPLMADEVVGEAIQKRGVEGGSEKADRVYMREFGSTDSRMVR